MPAKDHWDKVYAARQTDGLSWYQQHAERSLQLIRECGVDCNAALVDVGGGASTLVDDLLARGFRRLTVLDLSSRALADARERLGTRAAEVAWLQADITTADLPPNHFALWHDRAVFHFLVDAAARAAYVKQVLHALQPGGCVVIATFAEDGPQQCSGLPVMRYNAAALHAEFGKRFSLVKSEHEVHRTPSGSAQGFTYCVMRKD